MLGRLTWGKRHEPGSCRNLARGRAAQANLNRFLPVVPIEADNFELGILLYDSPVVATIRVSPRLANSRLPLVFVQDLLAQEF